MAIMEPAIGSQRRDAQRPKQRILVVDDHPLMRRGMAAIIGHAADLELCGEAASPAEALRIAHETSPDLVVVDLSLGEGSGLDLIRDLAASGARARVLVSSMHDDSIYAERVLHAGALGYVNKQEPPETFLAAVRRVLAGDIYLAPSVAARLLKGMVCTNAHVGSPLEQLSNRELEVLEAIGEGEATRETADRMLLSVKTIETYRERIKAKLQLDSAAELMRYAIHWVMSGDADRREAGTGRPPSSQGFSDTPSGSPLHKKPRLPDSPRPRRR